MNSQGRDLGFDSLRVAQQQITLLTRGYVSTFAVCLVCTHVMDADAHGSEASQGLQGIEVLFAVTPVPAFDIAKDRADQPYVLVIAQRGLTQPASPGHILNRESCHGCSETHFKRFKHWRL
jgi:hypothetical protein